MNYIKKMDEGNLVEDFLAMDRRQIASHTVCLTSHAQVDNTDTPNGIPNNMTNTPQSGDPVSNS